MLRHQVANFISQLAQTAIADSDIVAPPKAELGDYAFGCFALAKEKQNSPVEIAKKLAGDIKAVLQSDSLIAEVLAAGPYINITLNSNIVAKQVLSGTSTISPTGQKILLETFQSNPFKEFHIGHFRNVITGESLRRLLLAAGHNVTTVSYMGDVGGHVAVWLWYYQNFLTDKTPGPKFTKWVGEIYAQAKAKAQEDESYREQIAEVNRQLDARQPELISLWQKLRQPCLDDFWRIAKELDATLDDNFFESQSEGPGKKLVAEWLEQGRVKKDQGAVIVDLADKKLGVFLLLKTDGTALYSTKDLGLITLKKQKYDFDLSVVVTGSEQEHYFAQLYETMDRFALLSKEKNIHVSYGLVSLADGKMSSRLGNVISYDDLHDQAIAKAKEIIAQRNPDLPNADQVAQVVGLGAVKFAMLSIDMSRTLKFDWDSALSFEGDTGPYLQYTYARIQSLKRKAGQVITNVDFNQLQTPVERQLLIKIAEFEEVVLSAAKNYTPPLVARYALELATVFNHFYHQQQVISDSIDLTTARLALADRVGQTLANSLDILSIGVIEEM